MTKGYTIHPLFMIMAVVGIGSGLYTLYQRVPAVAPAVLFCSLVGLTLRSWQLTREESRDSSPSGGVDFAALRAKDFRRYGPWLKDNVRGHDAVVDSLTRRLQQGLELAGPNRTLGTFLLVGPTGTGKTFLSEMVARALFPGSEPLILRMNQYKHHDDVFTLLGPPPGAAGYEIGGALTRPVLENPQRVILLDEIDKCHPDIRDCLYNILDTAQCREKSSGRAVHFHACAFFATCNAGVESLRQLEAAKPDAAARIGRARDALARAAAFEKSFLARFDEIYLLDELPLMNVAEVALLQLAKHWKEYGIEVTYASPEILVDAIRRNSEFSEYGVRQLSHLIQGMADPWIEAAKKGGANKVRLDVDQGTGKINVVLLT